MSALIVIGIESIADQIYDFRIREPFRSLENLEPSMNLVSKSTDLIAVNGETHYPTIMYFAHRRGWSLSNELLLDSIYVNDIRSKGCKYILIAKTISGDIQLDYTKVLESEYFKIYRIE